MRVLARTRAGRAVSSTTATSGVSSSSSRATSGMSGSSPHSAKNASQSRRRPGKMMLTPGSVREHPVDVEDRPPAPAPSGRHARTRSRGTRVRRSLLGGSARGAAAQLLDHGGVGERRRVAEIAALGDVPEQPAHDLAGAGLRKILGEDDRPAVGRWRRSCRTTWARSASPCSLSTSRPCFKVTKAMIAWPGRRRRWRRRRPPRPRSGGRRAPTPPRSSTRGARTRS